MGPLRTIRVGGAVGTLLVVVYPDEAWIAIDWTWATLCKRRPVCIRGVGAAVALMLTLRIACLASPRVIVAGDTVFPNGAIWQGYAIAGADNALHEIRAALADACVLWMAEKTLVARVCARNV